MAHETDPRFYTDHTTTFGSRDVISIKNLEKLAQQTPKKRQNKVKKQKPAYSPMDLSDGEKENTLLQSNLPPVRVHQETFTAGVNRATFHMKSYSRDSFALVSAWLKNNQ